MISRIQKGIRRRYNEKVRRWRLSRASELERIGFYKGVVHGERIRLTGRVNFGSEPFLIRLGSDITIADGVRFITHDGGARIFRREHPDLHVYAPISVGSEVFIGVNAIILPGVSIGDRCVIGAGSVVTKDIPTGQVWAGVPAHFIKSTDEYRAGVLSRGIQWTVGDYGVRWREKLESDLLSASRSSAE